MLTFQELICASPFYHAEIIGGWKGKEKSFSIVEEDTAHLDKPALLIMPGNPETVSQLDHYISTQNVQGILLFGGIEPYIPHTLIETIESFHKPVLFLKEEINSFSLKKTTTDLAQLKTMGLFHYVYEHSTHYWLQLIQEQGLSECLCRLSLLLNQEIFLLDEHFYLHPIHEGRGVREQFQPLASIYDQQNATNHKREVFSMIDDGQYHYFLFPLLSDDQRYGFILFQEQPSMMIDVCTEQVIHTIPALLAYFQKEEAVL